MYTTGTGMTAAAGGGMLAYTGVPEIWGVSDILILIVSGVLFILAGIAMITNSVYRDRKEARIAGV